MSSHLKWAFSTLAALTLAVTATAQDSIAQLEALANGKHRTEANVARNEFRHPAETLAFFGLRPDLTVVEISPGGGGWYTEILAPYLKDRGTLYAGSYDPASAGEYYRENAKRYADKLAERPDIYRNVRVTVFALPDQADAAPDGSADLVLTFRNLHNWKEDGHAEAALKAMYRYLKPGGILGLVQHRGDPAAPQHPKAEYGYIRQDEVIAMANAAGFHLVAASEINANPKDSKNHPEGVWSLPPAYRGGDVDRGKYAAIGESDRMTLKFRKPL